MCSSDLYKDVPALIQRYQELNTNANLQTYLMSPTGDFVALCRRFVASYYSDATVKIEDATVTQEFVEILCTVDTPRWEDSEMFRFYRSTGAIGELYVRDFHAMSSILVLRLRRASNSCCLLRAARLLRLELLAMG